MSYGTKSEDKGDAYDGREKRALQYLVGLGEANRAQRIELPGCESPHRWAFWNPCTGALELHDAPIGPRQYIAESLESFAAIMNDVGTAQSRVFVSSSEVVGVIDPQTRERVIMPLEVTDEWSAMIGTSAQRTQVEFLNAMKRGLQRYESTSLVMKLRLLKLRSEREQAGTVSHGSETLRADVRREAVAGDAPIPDGAKFTLCVYRQFSEPTAQVTVEAALEIDIDKGKLWLTPLTGELHGAITRTLELMRAWIEAETAEKQIPCWCARPE